jgi:putative ABC transport system permease protein
MSTLLQEISYAVRQLWNAPGFALLAVLTLALGIGANTAMFTVIESVLLHPLPYQHSDRMVYIGPADGDSFQSTSWVTYRDLRDQAQKLENVALFSEDVGVVQGKEGSVSVVTPGVTPNTFRLLGVQPLLGRRSLKTKDSPAGRRRCFFRKDYGARSLMLILTLLGKHYVWMENLERLLE